MEEFAETYQKWRRKLFHVNVLVAVFVALVELAMYVVIKGNELAEPALPVYLWRYVLVPTIADFSVIITGYVFLKKKSGSKFVNYVPTIQLAFICMVVAVVHYVFSVTLVIFIVPVFTTVIYSDKRLTNRISVLCHVFLAVSLIHRKFSAFVLGKDQVFYEEAFAAFVVLLCSSVICNCVIEFQEEKDRLIQRYYLDKLKMQDQLNKDQKTGLYGNTIFMNTLDNVIASADDQIALAVMDIDDFKKVNDSFGHLNGDHVITALAGIMKKRSGADRFMARFGGEEFVILFTGAEADYAALFLEDFRKEVEEQEYEFTDRPITVSIGLAFWKQGLTPEDLFNKADEAMYQAKARGKNQIFASA